MTRFERPGLNDHASRGVDWQTELHRATTPRPTFWRSMKLPLNNFSLRVVLVLVAGLPLVALPSYTAAEGQDSGSGASVFKAKCVSCHGADGSGNTPVGKSLQVADLRSPEVQKKSDAELAESVSEGKGNMP